MEVKEMSKQLKKQWSAPTLSEFDIAEHTLLGTDLGGDGIEGEQEVNGGGNGGGNGGAPGS